MHTWVTQTLELQLSYTNTWVTLRTNILANVNKLLKTNFELNENLMKIQYLIQNGVREPQWGGLSTQISDVL